MKYILILFVCHAQDTFELSFIHFDLVIIFIIELELTVVIFKMLEMILRCIRIIIEHHNYLCLDSFSWWASL